MKIFKNIKITMWTFFVAKETDEKNICFLYNKVVVTKFESLLSHLHITSLWWWILVYLSYLLTMVTSSCLSFIFARYGDEFLFIFWVFKKVFIFTFVHSSYPILIFVLNIFSSNYFITVLIFPTFLRNFRIRQWRNYVNLLSRLTKASGNLFAM